MRLLSSPPPLAAMTLYLLSSVLFSTTCVSASALEVVQIEVPPRTDYDAGQSCRQVIFRHTFANSDGIPYVGNFASPSHTPASEFQWHNHAEEMPMSQVPMRHPNIATLRLPSLKSLLPLRADNMIAWVFCFSAMSNYGAHRQRCRAGMTFTGTIRKT